MDYSIDATNKVLGRLASEVAHMLRGAKDPSFNPARMGSDTVVVYNTDKMRVTGKKLTQKSYYRHSGFPGGIREEKLKTVMIQDSRIALKRAVMGMLPKNKLRPHTIKKLNMFRGEVKNTTTRVPN